MLSLLFAGGMSIVIPMSAASQDMAAAAQDTTLQSTIEAGESSVEEPKRKLVKWNEFDGPFTTLRVGAGLLFDAATFVQDEANSKQFNLTPDMNLRDFRFFLKGRLKLKRSVTWSCGIMYDGASTSWLFRETGIMIAVPELWGNLFIGRTKEGYSLNKVMVGYAGWTMERATINDATIPILADGVKWLGYLPSRHLLWNIGWYHDWLSEGQSFSTYSSQFVVRIAAVPLLGESSCELLHIGLNGRYGEAYNHKLRLRSRPENFLSPYFVDTGEFPAVDSWTAGWEVYFRSGSLLLGTEYSLQKVHSPETGSPLFHGGDVVLSWLITGETRGYNTVGGYFRAISPTKTVFDSGPGAWEAVLRLSYIDLDSKTLNGGKFWRATPMVNWHLSDNLRLEFAYGYGRLSRFDLVGGTQFFQCRIQMQL